MLNLEHDETVLPNWEPEISETRKATGGRFQMSQYLRFNHPRRLESLIAPHYNSSGEYLIRDFPTLVGPWCLWLWWQSLYLLIGFGLPKFSIENSTAIHFPELTSHPK